LKPEEFSACLTHWHARAGRKDLPWQQDPSPYRVWVSEIMLQQTQVSTVLSYYPRFMERFPEVQQLASAALDQVLGLWSGLGYYARARNLHRAAEQICEHHGGRVPLDFDALCTLPGIGRSTAGAILALAAGLPYPILDGNAKRVLTRFHGLGGWPGEPRVEQELWRLAERYTPARAAGVYTQAIMDLGATLCTRSQPQCGRCPIAQECAAQREGNQESYPAPRPRKALPVRFAWVLLLESGAGQVLLERRPPVGIWGGLWSFPECDSLDAATRWIERHVDCGRIVLQPWPVVRHTFTHFHLDLHPLHARLRDCTARQMEDAQRVWYKIGHQSPFGITAAVKRLSPMLDRSLAGDGE
jgi:A/G-specific adenine glycosylase